MSEDVELMPFTKEELEMIFVLARDKGHKFKYLITRQPKQKSVIPERIRLCESITRKALEYLDNYREEERSEND